MNPSTQAVASRLSAAFFFAHDLFLDPSAGQWRRLGCAQVRQVWKELAGILDPGAKMMLPDSYEVFASEHRTVFDLRGAGPHVSLTESAYSGENEGGRIIRENLLFYDLFGLQAPEESGQAADHLRRQLEFVGICYRLESGDRGGRSRAEILRHIRRARGAFLNLHLLNWLPEALARAESGGTAWVKSFLSLTLLLVQAAAEESEEPAADGDTSGED